MHSPSRPCRTASFISISHICILFWLHGISFSWQSTNDSHRQWLIWCHSWSKNNGTYCSSFVSFSYGALSWCWFYNSGQFWAFSIKLTILFQHVVFFFTWLVTYLIPDIPRHVRQLMLRELYIAKESRYTAAFANVHKDKADRKREEESSGNLKPEDELGPQV